MPDTIKLILISFLSRVNGRSIFWLRIYFMLNIIFYKITDLKIQKSLNVLLFRFYVQ